MTTVEHAGFTIGDTVKNRAGQTGVIARFSHQQVPTYCFVRYGSQRDPKATYLTDLERVQP